MDYPFIKEATPEKKDPGLSWEQSGGNRAAQDTPQEKTTAAEFGVKALALVGVIALLAFAVWGTVQIARVAPGALTAAVANLSAIFVGNDEDERIVFTLDTHTLADSEPFTLSWMHETDRTGSYILRYDCAEGVSLETKNGGGRLTAIRCGNPYTLSTLSENETGEYEFTFTPYSIENRFSDVSLALTFVPESEDEATVQGTTLLTVINTSISANGTAQSEPENETGGATGGTGGPVTAGPSRTDFDVISGTGGVVGVSDPNGIPDLAVTVLAVGYVDRLGETFTPSAVVNDNQRAAVRFEVRNVGTKASGEWSFEAELPVQGRSSGFDYEPRENQRSLNPSERIEYTLGFDNISTRNELATIRIVVDPNNRVAETNRTNNSATASILVED